MTYEKAIEVYEYMDKIKSLEKRINMIDDILSKDDLEFSSTHIPLESKDMDFMIPIKSGEIWGVLEGMKTYFEGIKDGLMVQLKYL